MYEDYGVSVVKEVVDELRGAAGYAAVGESRVEAVEGAGDVDP